MVLPPQDPHLRSSSSCLGRLRMSSVGGPGKGKKIWTEGTQGLIPIIGSPQIENIQPFSAKDLSIRSLGDRIRDLAQLKNLYPKKPKDEAFRSHYKRELELRARTPSCCPPSPCYQLPLPCPLCVMPDSSLHFCSLTSPTCPSAMPPSPPSLPNPGAFHSSPFLPTTDEQIGKDGRGYVPATIKMTVER